VVNKIPGHLLQAFLRCNHVIVAFEFLLKALRHVDIIQLQGFQLLGNTFVQVANRQSLFVSTGIVVERDGRIVFYRTLEIIGGDIVAKHAAGDLIVLEQWRTGEADALGRALRMFSAKVPYWVRCASSVMTMMSSRSL